MKDAVKDGVDEIVSGPDTLLVYALTAVGVVLALTSGQDSEAFQSYLEFIGEADVFITGLVGARGLMAGLKGYGSGKVAVEKAVATPAPPA